MRAMTSTIAAAAATTLEVEVTSSRVVVSRTTITNEAEDGSTTGVVDSCRIVVVQMATTTCKE